MAGLDHKPGEDGVLDVAELFRRQEQMDMLRFITCGSVDDGKSTLIGRLLFDSKLLFEDQLLALEADSRKFGTTGEGQIDLALLVDGLQAEREQGITIDVAYRFFATDKRKFIVADTPGHEQYTRNMVTGASTADAAVVLIDARKGILTQTRRHSFIVSLMGIRHVVLAVNKMDLVGFDQARFEAIAAEYRDFAGRLGISAVTYIPLSALTGDNVLTPSKAATPWYDGPALVPHLESLGVTRDLADKPFRMPIQWVNRPDLDFRGYAGTVTSGKVRPGQTVAIMPSGRTATIDRVVVMGGDKPAAVAGEAVTITLAEDVDVGRGDVLCDGASPPVVTDQFAADLVWMSDQPLLTGRGYLLQLGTTLIGAQVTDIKHRINVNTLEHSAAKRLELNEVGVANLALDRAITFDVFAEDKALGSFILVDRLTNATVGCGMVKFPLRRALNLHWQSVDIHKAARAGQKRQKPCVLWFTGFSGAGKSTVANLVEKKLFALGHHTYLLDGDNVRHGLTKDLGFTEEDRVENIRRIGEVARLFVDAGLIVLTAFISPFRADRQMARSLVDPDEFIEIFVDTDIDECERRDPKGLYKKAREGKIPNLTGINSPYEAPQTAELTLAGGDSPPDALADMVIDLLRQRGII